MTRRKKEKTNLDNPSVNPSGSRGGGRDRTEKKGGKQSELQPR